MILNDLIKITLSIGTSTVDVTRDVAEWDGFEILQERDDTSGVISSVSIPVKLKGDGMGMLRQAFSEQGLYATGRINVYKRGDYDNMYDLIKSAPLDFSTYEEHSDHVSIECSESELMDIINSEGKTKYDILVKDIKDSKRWNYKRMEVRNIGVYTLPEDQDIAYEQDLPQISNFQFPVSLSKANQSPGTSEVDFKSQSSGISGDDYFLSTSDKSVEMIFDSNFKFEMSIEVKTMNHADAIGIINGTIYCGIYRFDNGQNAWLGILTGGLKLEGHTEISNLHVIGNYSGKITASNLNFTLNPNEKVALMVRIPGAPIEFWRSATYARMSFKTTEFNKLEAYYYEASRNAVSIDVIKPDRLLNKYLSMMSGDDRFAGAIEWEKEDYKTIIVAAESVRGFGEVKGAPGGAYLHGSPNDFIEWLRVLGYEPVIDGNAITFKARDKVFLPGVTAMELEEGEVADLVRQADSTFAYTSVEIGYEKQDYENENGIYEANGTYAYTTGYVTREDNKLSLISPYRADSMGIEFLCQERDNYTTDDKSDNDIFFVALKEQEGDYVEYMDTAIDTDSGRIRMFNAPFNPYFLVLRNESLIGINTRQLKFKSTDMSREAKIPGYDIYGDVEISKRLFLPVVYNFAAGHTKDMPTDNRDGLVKVAWRGETLQGYIKSVRKNYLTEEETTWELHAVTK